MDYVPLEDLLKKTGGSVYKLVILAAKRALQISEGQPTSVNLDSKKPIQLALEEIAEGKVGYEDKKKKK